MYKGEKGRARTAKRTRRRGWSELVKMAFERRSSPADPHGESGRVDVAQERVVLIAQQPPTEV